MTLDPQVAHYLQSTMKNNTSPNLILSIAEQRRLAELSAIADAGEPEQVEASENRLIPGPGGALPIRIYTPYNAVQKVLPALVYFHSGGWVMGSIAGHDPICRKLANRAGCMVVSVGYRLAPEHPFPAAPEDCYAATSWVVEHADEIHINPTRIAIGGDSAGGNLAAAVALMARDRQGPLLRQQIIIYGETDYYDPGTTSYQTYAEGYGLTRAEMITFWDQYLARPEDCTHPYAAPLRANDLSGLPPALIITAEYDPVRDEAELYAARLQEAGVSTQISRYPGMIHSFFRMFTIFEQSHQALEEVSRTLRTAFAEKTSPHV